MSRARPALLSEKTMDVALSHLKECDEVMSKLINEHPRCSLAKRQNSPFHTLVTAIISQQLSAKAANTIQRRVAALTTTPFEANCFLGVETEVLRSAGLSQAKARYIRELASRIVSGTIDFHDLEIVAEEEAIASLTELPGIGQWTAEMFLIFGLRRPDVLSLGDAGLQRAAKLLYAERLQNSGNHLEEASRAWSPYRSIASWYLWKHLDSEGVNPEKMKEG